MTNPMPEEMENLIAEIEDVEETLTDWDLCPFCCRKGDETVGQAEERHEMDCLKPRIISYLRTLLSENEELRDKLDGAEVTMDAIHANFEFVTKERDKYYRVLEYLLYQSGQKDGNVGEAEMKLIERTLFHEGHD